MDTVVRCLFSRARVSVLFSVQSDSRALCFRCTSFFLFFSVFVSSSDFPPSHSRARRATIAACATAMSGLPASADPTHTPTLRRSVWIREGYFESRLRVATNAEHCTHTACTAHTHSALHTHTYTQCTTHTHIHTVHYTHTHTHSALHTHIHTVCTTHAYTRTECTTHTRCA